MNGYSSGGRCLKSRRFALHGVVILDFELGACGWEEVDCEHDPTK